MSLIGRIKGSPVLRGMPHEVTVIAAIAFCVAIGYGIVAPAIPIYARSFGVSAFLAGAVVSVFALMRLVSAPGAGVLIDRAGERLILTSGLVFVAVSSVLAGLASDYTQLLILRGVGGVGSSMFTVSAMALMLKVVGPEQRGRAAAAFQAGFLLGGVAGPAVGGLVLAWSVRAPFFVYAATLAVASAVSWRYLPSEPPGTPVVTDAGAPAEPPITLGGALRMRAYWTALCANLTNGLVSFGLRFSLVPLFVIEGLHSAASLAGIGFLVAAATQAVLLLPAGRMADTRGRRPALVLGTLLTALGMAALVVTQAPPMFLVAMAVAGTAGAFMGSVPAAVAGDIVGRSGKGTVIAVFQMTADLGVIVGPLLAGLLADSWGFGPAFAVGAAVAVAAFVMAVVMPETLRTKQAPPGSVDSRNG